jgi:hypothetical protein
MPSAGRNPRPSLAGSRSRGITAADVDRAADSLLHDGERPTIEKVRARIGRGSPNTINPLLDAWWSRLAGRLDSGPAALHRLPQPVAMAAEALWLTAVEAARERASQESRSAKSRLADDRRELEVRSHILSIREAELTDRLGERERRIERLEAELHALLTMLRKEQASRAALERRLASEESTPDTPRARPKAARRKTAAKKAPARRKAATKKAPARRSALENQPKQARKSAGRKTFSSRRVTARTAKRTNR